MVVFVYHLLPYVILVPTLQPLSAECPASLCQKFSASLHKTLVNHRLQSHLLQSFHSATGPKGCLHTCALECGCMSFNFKKSEQLCEINYGDNETTPWALVADTDYDLYSLEFENLEHQVSVKRRFLHDQFLA